MANTRYVTLLTKQSNQPSSALPSSAATGEALVNTADGKVYYKGYISGTGSTTYVPSLSNAAFFEVGSHLSQLKLDDKIITYSGVSNLSGLFLSGTSNGFVLAPISSIVTTDTYLTGGTFNYGTHTLTLNLNNGAPSVNVTGFTDIYVTGSSFNNNLLTITNNTGGTFSTLINNFTGLTVNGTISATTISATTFYGNGANLTGVATANTFTTASTYNASTGTLSFTRNDGNTYTAGTWSYISAATLSSGNVLSITSNGGSVVTTTINAATGGTYSNGTITLAGSGTLGTITGLTQSAATIYTSDGTLQANRTVGLSSYTLNFSSATAPNTLFLSGGSVGIGTATPTFKLDVNGGVRAVNGFYSTSAFTGSYTDGLVADYITGNGRISVGSGDSITFYNNGPNTTANMIISSGGSVGIGTITPTNQLTVSASSNPVKFIGIQSATDSQFITQDATGVLHYRSDVLTGTQSTSAVTLSSNVLSVALNGGGTTATTINAATGGTYSNGTITLAGTGTLSNITGLPLITPYDTGFTYNNANTFTITNNTGGTLNASINIMTGLTVNGNVTVTGNTNVSGNTVNIGSITAANLYTTPTGSAIIGTGGLIVGSGGSEGNPGTGDVVINGSLTVFGNSVSAFTSNIYSEDQNITLNYNPTGNTYLTSLTGGFTIQNGWGVSGLTGDSIFFQIAQTGVPTSYADAISKRFWETQLANIMIGSTGGTGTGNYVLQATDILSGGNY
jgi:fibronectin-binding autotransporter adhesin